MNNDENNNGWSKDQTDDEFRGYVETRELDLTDRKHRVELGDLIAEALRRNLLDLVRELASELIIS